MDGRMANFSDQKKYRRGGSCMRKNPPLLFLRRRPSSLFPSAISGVVGGGGGEKGKNACGATVRSYATLDLNLCVHFYGEQLRAVMRGVFRIGPFSFLFFLT